MLITPSSFSFPILYDKRQNDNHNFLFLKSCSLFFNKFHWLPYSFFFFFLKYMPHLCFSVAKIGFFGYNNRKWKTAKERKMEHG
jgi:hypothetical protein